MMKTRDAVLGFHYAERAKSQLLLAHRLMEIAAGLSGEEAQGGRKVVLGYLEGIRGEILGGTNVSPHILWEKALQWLDRAVEDSKMADASGCAEALSRCLSSVTTLGQRTMEILLERQIL